MPRPGRLRPLKFLLPLLIYGGQGENAVKFGDLWQPSFGENQTDEISFTGPSPGAIANHALVYDSARDRLLVLGGHDGTSSRTFDRIWELPLSDSPIWNELIADGPLPEVRSYPVVRYDPLGDRVIMFAGSGGSGELSDVWELTLGDELAWRPILPAGGTPEGRHYAEGVIDPTGPRMLVYGGKDERTTYGDTWALDLGAFSLTRSTTA